ncbi:hypothetical protein [Microcoleus sp. BROC3]|uniref:hypothetical protein n=1 Tax=Microcoleus sp. BROC3 TaxID=3055323 RepID=UPI002FD6179E
MSYLQRAVALVSCEWFSFVTEVQQSVSWLMCRWLVEWLGGCDRLGSVSRLFFVVNRAIVLAQV